MGTDPASLSKEQLERMAPADRQLVAAAVGHPNAGLTTISFSHRVKDEVENSIDTAQEELPIKVTIRKGRTNE
jgi:hypothetical protein